jgi:hypothetical protein
MYLFNIIGVASILHFFNHEQAQKAKPQPSGVTYIASYSCSLDAVIQSVENTQFQPNWQQEDILQSVMNFWLANLDSVTHWQQRLQDSGSDTLLISRVADPHSLRQELELVFQSP